MAPTPNATIVVAHSSRREKTHSGMIGSGARRSTTTNATNNTTPAVNAPMLGADFQAYDAAYELSGKRVAKAPVDPVEREATRIAKEQVDAALRRKGIDKKALADGQYDGYVASLLAKNPAIRDEARAYIERVRSEGAKAMADDLLAEAA